MDVRFPLVLVPLRDLDNRRGPLPPAGVPY